MRFKHVMMVLSAIFVALVTDDDVVIDEILERLPSRLLLQLLFLAGCSVD